MGFTSCWHQRVRETVVCRAQGKMQVESGLLSGLGMKGPAGDWVGEAGSASPTMQPPSHPTASLPAKEQAPERRSRFLCTRKQPLPIFLTCCLPVPMCSGSPGQLIVPKDRAMGVARAARGDCFCRFVNNKTKAGL